MFSSGLGQNGEVTGELSSGFRSKWDNSINGTDGYKITQNVGNPTTTSGQFAKELLEKGLKPTEALIAAAVRGKEELSKYLQEQGIEEGTAEAWATGIVGSAGLGAFIGGTEVGQRAWNLAKGNMVATQDMQIPNGGFDKDGKPTYDTVKKGATINVDKNDYIKEYYKNNKGNFEVEKGIPGKFASRMFGGGVDAEVSLFPEESKVTSSSNETSNKSSNPSNSTDNEQSDKKPKNQTDKNLHKNSLNNNELYNRNNPLSNSFGQTLGNGNVNPIEVRNKIMTDSRALNTAYTNYKKSGSELPFNSWLDSEMTNYIKQLNGQGSSMKNVLNYEAKKLASGVGNGVKATILTKSINNLGRL